MNCTMLLHLFIIKCLSPSDEINQFRQSKVTLQPTVSQSVHLDAEPRVGLMTRF
jgi:hypothetical protein